MRALRAGLIAWSAVVPAVAQERPALEREITIERVVEYARERSARTRALRSEGAVAEADVAVASVYPNPTVSYSVYGRMRGQSEAINGSQHQVWVEQPILLGQDGRRRDAARGAAMARRAEIESSVFDVTIEARQRFVALLAAQEVVRLLEAMRAELGRLSDLVQGRAASGAQSAYDVARVEMEVAQLDARIAGAEADVSERSAALAGWLGLVGWSPVARGDFPTQAAALTFERLWPLARSRSAGLLAARRRVAATTLDVRRAERERWPVPTLGMGTYVTTDGGSTSLYGSVSLPVPLWDTGSAQLSRSRAAGVAAAAVEQAIEAELHARLEGALRAHDGRRAALERHQQGAMAGLARLREMAEESYRSGASRIFDLLDAFRTQLAVQEQRIELIETLEQSRIEVDAAAGFEAP